MLDEILLSMIANIAQENDSSQERWERRISSNTTASKYANIEKLAVIKGKKKFLKILYY